MSLKTILPAPLAPPLPTVFGLRQWIPDKCDDVLRSRRDLDTVRNANKEEERPSLADSRLYFCDTARLSMDYIPCSSTKTQERLDSSLQTSALCAKLSRVRDEKKQNVPLSSIYSFPPTVAALRRMTRINDDGVSVEELYEADLQPMFYDDRYRKPVEFAADLFARARHIDPHQKFIALMMYINSIWNSFRDPNNGDHILPARFYLSVVTAFVHFIRNGDEEFEKVMPSSSVPSMAVPNHMINILKELNVHAHIVRRFMLAEDTHRLQDIRDPVIDNRPGSMSAMELLSYRPRLSLKQCLLRASLISGQTFEDACHSAQRVLPVVSSMMRIECKRESVATFQTQLIKAAMFVDLRRLEWIQSEAKRKATACFAYEFYDRRVTFISLCEVFRPKNVFEFRDDDNHLVRVVCVDPDTFSAANLHAEVKSRLIRSKEAFNDDRNLRMQWWPLAPWITYAFCSWNYDTRDSVQDMQARFSNPKHATLPFDPLLSDVMKTNEDLVFRTSTSFIEPLLGPKSDQPEDAKHKRAVLYDYFRSLEYKWYGLSDIGVASNFSPRTRYPEGPFTISVDRQRNIVFTDQNSLLIVISPLWEKPHDHTRAPRAELLFAPEYLVESYVKFGKTFIDHIQITSNRYSLCFECPMDRLVASPPPPLNLEAKLDPSGYVEDSIQGLAAAASERAIGTAPPHAREAFAHTLLPVAQRQFYDAKRRLFANGVESSSNSDNNNGDLHDTSWLYESAANRIGSLDLKSLLEEDGEVDIERKHSSSSSSSQQPHSTVGVKRKAPESSPSSDSSVVPRLGSKKPRITLSETRSRLNTLIPLGEQTQYKLIRAAPGVV